MLTNMCRRWNVTGTQREEYGYSRFSNAKNLPCITCSTKHQCVKACNSQNPGKQEDHYMRLRLNGPLSTQPSANHEEPSVPRRPRCNLPAQGVLFC